MIKVIGNGSHAKLLRVYTDKMVFSSGTLIGIGNNHYRKEEAEAQTTPFAVFKHPSAVISSEIGAGTVVLENAVIEPGCKIGKHCIINAGALVCHDCILEDYVHIAPGATLCGGVMVGEGALIGAGAIVVTGSSILPWQLVKAGSVCK